MTVKWMLLIVFAIVAALWIVWGALKAFNGIVYEMTLLQEYIRRHSDPEEVNA